MSAIEVPTVYIGRTQSGKTWRAVRDFEAHQGPAIFCDVQWRMEEYSPETPRVTRFEEVVSSLAAWNGVGDAPRIAWTLDDYRDLVRLFDYTWTVHRRAHVGGKPLPHLLIVLDEVSLAADTSARADNPAVRLFTQGYQHGIIGAAVTQRPAQTSRNVLGNAWEWLIFSLDEGDLVILRSDYQKEPPEPEWTRDPLAHRYWRKSALGWLKGDENGNEVSVMREGPAQDVVSEGHQAGGQEDLEGHGAPPMPEPKVRDGVGPQAPQG